MRTVIIGAVALGASCAARLKRLSPKDEVILLEKGSYASFANCGLPYFVGDEIKSQDKLLVVKASTFHDKYDIDLRVHSEVDQLDPVNSKVHVFNTMTKESYWLKYDNLVLAMGADAIIPPIEGMDNEGVYFLKTVDDAVSLKEKLSTVKKVAVIGGGFIGLEAMENLVLQGKEVDLIEGRPSVSTLDYDMARIVHKIIESHGVHLHLNTMVKGLKKDDEGFLIETTTGIIKSDIVLFAIGVRPNVSLASNAGIELDTNRCIKVDNYLRTNYPNIYAGGDLVSNYDAVTSSLVYVPLANYANKHGRIIADNICGLKRRRQKIAMASVFKLFDYTVASVGLGETLCSKFNIETNAVYQNGFSHATYYPNAHNIHAKLRYDATGKIYGAQMIGKDLVEKRIDVLSSILLHNGTYKDLMEVESSYAPPFNSAKDTLNFFGFMIDNIINRGLKTISPLEIDKIKDEVFLLDVRDNQSYLKGHIGNALNIPLEELRENTYKLPKNQTIYIHCNVGINSYLACCILQGLGFDCCNVSGGYSLYHLICE